MRRVLIAMFAASLATQVSAETLRLCHSTATLDDLVKLTLVIEDPDNTAEFLDVPIPDGLVVAARTRKRDTDWVPRFPGSTDKFRTAERIPKPKVTLELLLRPAREGTFVIGPVEIPHSVTPSSTAPAVTLRVLPNLDLSGKSYPAAIRALEKAGMARVHFVAHAPASCYVGEQVTVRWTLATAEELEDLTILENPVIDEATVPTVPDKRFFQGRDETEGMSFRGVREITFYASAPGKVFVGPMTVRAVGRSKGTLRENETFIRGQGLEAIRTTPPFNINVLPLPEGVSAAAVGKLSLDCSTLSTNGNAWIATATVRGNASLFEDVKIHWTEPPDFETELTPEPVHSVRSPSTLVREQRWLVRIPAVKEGRAVILPSLTVDWFDAESGTLSKSTCWEPNNLRLLTERSKLAPVVARPAAAAPKPPRRRWFRSTLELLKPIVIVVSIVFLLTQIGRFAR